MLTSDRTAAVISLHDFGLLTISSKPLGPHPQSPTHFRPSLPIIISWQCGLSALSTFLTIAQNVKKVRTLKMLSLEPLVGKLCFIHQMKAISPNVEKSIGFLIHVALSCKNNELTYKIQRQLYGLYQGIAEN